MAARDLSGRRAAEEPEPELDLFPEQRERVRDALLAVDGERAGERSARERGAGAERERLQHVAAAAHAAVDVDLAAPVDRLRDLRQRIEPGGDAVELAPAVIRDPYRVGAVLDGECRVLSREDPFEDERKRHLA